MPNCLICYKDAGDKEFHEKCAKRFFKTTTMPELELDKKLLKQLRLQQQPLQPRPLHQPLAQL